MVKPIELDELVLRINALCRRANIEINRHINVGNLVLDADAMSAWYVMNRYQLLQGNLILYINYYLI